MTDYPTKPGYYYLNGKWYPSKKTKRQRAKDKLIREISDQIHLFPEKYPYTSFATSQATAKHLRLEVWWQKCKKGHLVERKVTERSCPVCSRITRDLRDKRIAESIVKLSHDEELRLHEIYKKAQKLTTDTGISHHVDHKRPLAAGGVHHPDNLQVITAEENLSKSSFYNGKKATYSKLEKKQAHLDFMKDKKRTEEEARLRLSKLKQLKVDEQRKHESKKKFAIVGVIALIIIIILI